jgi:putative copper export protein
MDQQTVMVVVRALHDLATAAWIGGMLALAIAVIPAVRRSLGTGPQTVQLLTSIQNRLSVVAAAAAAILLLTGLLLSRSATTAGTVSASEAYRLALAIKHVLAGAMVIVAIVRSRFVPVSKMKLKGGLLVLNIVLAVAVIALSSLTATLASAPFLR